MPKGEILMKKFLTLLLSLVVALTACVGLTACNPPEDTNKPVIVSGITLIEEQYGIAAKKGNDALISKVNDALIALADGQMKTIAGNYGLASEIAVTSTTTNPKAEATDDSWDKIVTKGKVIIGYTIFAPIAYEVVNDQPTKGYDIELAKAVFAQLDPNIEVEFFKIEWSAKEAMLEAGTIDLVWNGLTITPARSEEMCISIPYLNNKQVAVVMSKNAEKYSTIDGMKDAITGAEDGSAGEEQIAAKEIGSEYIKCKSQLDAFNMLKTGTLQVIVIDSVMANYYISLED